MFFLSEKYKHAQTWWLVFHHLFTYSTICHHEKLSELLLSFWIKNKKQLSVLCWRTNLQIFSKNLDKYPVCYFLPTFLAMPKIIHNSYISTIIIKMNVQMICLFLNAKPQLGCNQLTSINIGKLCDTFLKCLWLLITISYFASYQAIYTENQHGADWVSIVLAETIFD